MFTPASNHSSPSATVPLRRNGRPQACEPCRKRKMACDHTYPVCQRCEKRNTTGDCVYVAAPMTKVIGNEAVSTEHRLSEVSPALRQVAPPDPRRPYPYSKGRNKAFKSYTAPKSSTLFSTSSGYLGPTSFSSVFWENQSNLGPVLHSGESLQQLAALVEKSSADEIEVLLQFPRRTACKLLRCIPKKDTCDILLSTQDRWLSLGAAYCHEKFWETAGKYLQSPRTDENLEELAHILHKNAKIPWKEPENPEHWLQSFSGENIRWESLGLLFCAWIYGALQQNIDEDLFSSASGQKIGKSQCLLEMKNSLYLCVTLCSETDLINPLMVSLFYSNNLLQGSISGETSVLVWRQHGDLVCAETALGLHREADNHKSKISAATEFRRRVHACVYASDMSMASFTGRPPLLSHRYCSSPAPLDIADQWLLHSNQEELMRIAGTLDANGWNTDGRIYTSTRIRAKYFLALIRDEILEISLGAPAPTEFVVDRLLAIKERSETMWSSFPPCVKIGYEGDLASCGSFEVFARLTIRVRHIQNTFHIEQLLHRYEQTNGQAFLDLSREFLALVLSIWTERDRFPTRQFDFEWIILCYGVPPAGVLCLELLKQTKAHMSSLKLPRSETIQSLSLFIGFLDWVRPSAGNYQLCCRTRYIISRVLDQVLEGPAAAQTLAFPLDNEHTGHTSGAVYDFDLPGDFADFADMGQGGLESGGVGIGSGLGGFSYLDTFDWVKTPWMEPHSQ